MSSGKSTLINALVGIDLLPSMNRACTAKAVAILDNDMKQQFEIHAVNAEGKYFHINKATREAIIDFNESNDTSEMIIEGEIKGIKNSKKSLLLIDTPGINNSMDMSHEVVTRRVLDDYSEGLILYIINAQQIGTYDDSNFLSLIAQKLEDNKSFKILFVVNKMDLIDPQKENPSELINNCKNYIENKGIEDPVIIPISASSALLFKKVLDGCELTELEEENFLRNYKHFRREGYSLQDYIYISRRGELSENIVVDGISYSRAQIDAALENTGLPFLEKQIDETLVRSLKMKAPRITTKHPSILESKPVKNKQAVKYKKNKNYTKRKRG
jgi:ribosome biogenesis GTPase A